MFLVRKNGNTKNAFTGTEITRKKYTVRRNLRYFLFNYLTPDSYRDQRLKKC